MGAEDKLDVSGDLSNVSALMIGFPSNPADLCWVPSSLMFKLSDNEIKLCETNWTFLTPCGAVLKPFTKRVLFKSMSN